MCVKKNFYKRLVPTSLGSNIASRYIVACMCWYKIARFPKTLRKPNKLRVYTHTHIYIYTHTYICMYICIKRIEENGEIYGDRYSFNLFSLRSRRSRNPLKISVLFHRWIFTKRNDFLSDFTILPRSPFSFHSLSFSAYFSQSFRFPLSSCTSIQRGQKRGHRRDFP